jgi:hypothetical protein
MIKSGCQMDEAIFRATEMGRMVDVKNIIQVFFSVIFVRLNHDSKEKL